MRISLLYRGEYSQWRKRFMNYVEEQTDGEAMINSIKNGDHPLPIVAQVSLAGTAPNAIPTLKDPNNDTAKDLWDALERQMRGSEYGEQDRKAAILYECETFKATEGEQFLDTYLRYLQVINDLKKCCNKKDNCDVNDALGYKKKAVVVTPNPLALITTLLAKAFNRKKYYAKSTNNNLRTSLASSSANKKTEYVNWMESSSDSDQKINANMVFMAKMEKVLKDSDESSSSAEENIAEVAYYTFESESESEYESSEYYNNYTNYGLFVNDNDDQEVFHDAIESASENFIENHIDSQKDYDKSEKRIEKANQQSKDLENQNKELQEKNDVLINQVKHVVIDTHTECQAQYAKLEEERYEYMIRYSALCDNDKQHRKKIDEQEFLFDKMSRQLVEMNNNVLTRIGRVCFENASYFEKAKDLRPSLYDEKVIGLGYTPMFLTHLDEALEIEKFKRARENKIEFAYDYGNLNASYVNEKINFSDDYFQEIINPDFEKIDSPFQQTSSLKPYVPTVILEKIIIDLEDEVVSLLEKEKANLKTIESLKSKGFESNENAISESKNQSENDCQAVEKECDKVENSKVNTLGMFKLNVSQSVSPISVSKTSCASENVETKTKRKRHLDNFSIVIRPKHSGVIWKKKWSSNTSNVDLSSVSHSRLVVILYDSFDENNLFIFNDISVRNSPVSKMPFRKKPSDLLNINFEDDYFQEIINPDFEKIDSPFQQTSSLKPYVPNVILEKIIIDLEDEVVNLLEKEKVNLETIESLKSKECDKKENPKVIAPGMFKLNVSQCVSPISMSKSSCDSNNVEIKLKRKRHLDIFCSVRRPKNSSVIWKKKGSSNTSNVGLSAVSVPNLNKNVKRYSRKDLLASFSRNQIHEAFDQELIHYQQLSDTLSDLFCVSQNNEAELGTSYSGSNYASEMYADASSIMCNYNVNNISHVHNNTTCSSNSLDRLDDKKMVKIVKPVKKKRGCYT
nr:WRKY domain-containing protein [Tanacetum cinerariifolium]